MTNLMPSQAAIASEHRRARRQRTLKEGKVVLSDWTTIDCTIRDMTAGGARIVLGGATSLPAEFRLLAVADNMLRPVRLEWQRGLAAGVEFAGPGEPVAMKKPQAGAGLAQESVKDSSSFTPIRAR
jgi:hypothetical protein